MRRSLRRILPIAALALAVGCLHAPVRRRAVPDCPGEWVATQAIPGDFLLRQSLVVTRGDRIFALHLVAQKHGDELLLLGLHPLGAKLFTLRQRGLDAQVDALPAPALEIPPLNVLSDFHRARFLRVAGAGPDGIFEVRRDRTLIRERHAAGRLVQRSFEPSDPGAPPPVELRFEEASPGDGARVTIENPGCGYRAELTTLSEESLP